MLAHATACAGVGQAARRGWLFAVGWLVSGLWWLYISMHTYGGMAPWLAALAVLVLAAALALYYAGAMALYAQLRGKRPFANALLWAACWLLAELARGTLFTGFPWIASGYAHTVGPLAALAPWVGIYGVCAVSAWVAFTLATWSGPIPSRAAIVLSVWALGIVALPHMLPSEFTRPAGSLTVSLLQPNVAQELKFDPTRIEGNLSRMASQISSARGDLVVTPESVIPLTRVEVNDRDWASLREAFQHRGRGLLIGMFLGNDNDGYVNSLIGLSSDPQAVDYHYGKRHLLPFGEFVPPGFRWFVDLLDIPLGDQAAGKNTAIFNLGGQRLQPLICYEDLFGEDFANSVTGARSATILVNVSNLAWFGQWLVQDQHLQFSQMRALEFQRPVIRSTNTGATAVVNHHGQVAERLPALTRGTLEASVQGRSGDTPYARWLAATGLWPLALLALLLLLVLRRRD